MGLLDVPLMNRIRRELDARYGRGEKLVYGEPWSGGSSAACPGTVMADKGNMRFLDEEIGAFCDQTRDAVKGNVFEAKAGGFVNGGAFNAEWLACCVRGWAGRADMPFAAPSQTISYLSAHDDWTLWDKLVISMGRGRRFSQADTELLRANRLAAMILAMSQGRLFMLSGEEFARTKLGERNSYRSPLRINRMDWRRARQNRDLVEYYRGLIALRKTLPGLCDKGRGAHARVLKAVDFAPGAGYVMVDNDGYSSAYARVLLAVNTTQERLELELPEGEWLPLADGESAWRWQKAGPACRRIELWPVSGMILGQKFG